jgi:hypothetical protein
MEREMKEADSSSCADEVVQVEAQNQAPIHYM